jgi:ABC-type bacteriocin/lantibiotic exporter with double-glycine peptidase domain
MNVNIKRFWLLLKPDRKEIYQVYFYALFKGLIVLSLPLGIQTIINLIQGGAVSTSWIVLSILIAIGVFLNGFIQLKQMRIMENIQQQIFARAAFNFTFRIPKIKLEELQDHYAPELMNRFFEVLSIQKNLSKIIVHFSTAILQIIFGLILLSFYHPFFIIFSLLMVVIVWAIVRFTARMAMETSIKESKYKYKVLSWLEELARAKDSFKTAGNTSLPEQKTDGRVFNYIEAREKHYSILKIQYMLLLVFKILVALSLLIVGGLLVINQQMNIGQFVAAEIIILLVIESTEKIVLNLESVYDLFTSIEKLGEVDDFNLDDQTTQKDILPVDNKNPMDVELKNISFSYPQSTKKILNDINFHFQSGKKYVITGNNGSGKSTLLHLISGLYKPTAGNISINGHSFQCYKYNDLNSVVGNGLKEETLFEGTLMENITLGRKDISINDVELVLEKLFLKEYVTSIPKGLFTPVEPLGRKLPRSIIQKILLARALVNNPRFLSIEYNLDAIEIGERMKIQSFLFNKKNDWTLIMISNDEQVMKEADVVINMNNGAFESVSTQ